MMVENGYKQPCAVCSKIVAVGEGVCARAKIETMYSWDVIHHECSSKYFDLIKPASRKIKENVKVSIRPDRSAALLTF